MKTEVMNMSFAKIIAMITALLFAGGCGTNTPDDNILDGGNEMVERKEIRSFCYVHNGSISYDGYNYTFYRDEIGVHLTAEMNCGWEKLEIDLDDEVMDQLETIVYEHRMYSWDGFSKTNSNVMDGEGFSLYIDFMDDTRISAHGSNAFPEGYGDAESAFNKIFWDLTEIHADKIVENDPYDYSDE